MLQWILKIHDHVNNTAKLNLQNHYHSLTGVIRIGNIKYFQRITEAGHVFQLLNQESNIISGGSIWMAGHSYHTNNNEIFIYHF